MRAGPLLIYPEGALTMALELGTAFVTLLPSTRGFSAKLSSQVDGELRNAGVKPGIRFGQEFNSSAGKGLSGISTTITKHSSAASSAASRGGASAGKRFGSGFGSSATVALGTAFVAVGALVTAKVAGLVKGVVDAGSTMEQSQGAVTAIFKKNSAEIEKAASKAAQSVGLSANEYRELASALGAQLKNKGIVDYSKQTQKLVGLGADLAAQFGGSTKDAVASLNSALRGETDPIERYGVSINQAAIEAEAMRLGMVKRTQDTDKVTASQLRAENAQKRYNDAVKKYGAASSQAKSAQAGLLTSQKSLSTSLRGTKVKLGDQEKATAALSLITRQTADAQGAFGRESDTLAGKQARAQASIDNLKASIGHGLLPVFANVVGYINTNIVPAVQSFVDEFKKGEGAGGRVKAIFEQVGGTFKTLATIVSEQIWPPLRDFFANVYGGAKGLYDLLIGGDYTGALKNAFGWEEDHPFVDFLLGARTTAQSLYDVFVNDVLPILKNFGGYLTETIIPKLGELIGWLVENRTWIGGIATVVGSMWVAWKLYGTALAIWKGIAIAAGNAAKILAAGQAAVNFVMAANPIGIIVLALVGLVAGLVYAWHNSETFRDIVKGVWEAIKKAVSSVWEWMKSVFNNLKTWFTVTLPNAVNTVREKIVGAFDAIKSGLGSAFDWVKRNVFDRYVDAFKFIIGKAGDFGKNMAKAFRQVVRGIHTAVNWLLDKALGPLANAWNTIADKVGMGDKKMSVPQLPPLPQGWASGGWTGPGAKYQPAGVVHADEYVLRKEAVNRLRRTVGLSGLDHMNRTGEMPGYAKGGMVYQQMQSWLHTALPWARVTSSYRPGSITSSGNRSNHSMGRALDLVPSGKGTMMGIFNFLASKFPNAAELIYTPAGRRQIKNGRNMVYGGQVAADHYDHVHWAQSAFNGAASGGSPLDLISALLPPGVAAAISMAQIGYQALLGKLNTASPGTKGFNQMGAKQTDTLGTALRAKIAEVEAQQDAGPGAHSSASAADFKAGGGVERWRSTVLQALSIMGLPASLAGITLRRMQQESGGNPRAINNWDSNARRGTPSKGLMQTIDPTYRANAHPMYNKGPYDPLSNILASMRYALRTYGSLPRAYNRKGGYATGGLVTPQLYDTGGILSPGLTLVANNTGKPETVRTYAQEAELQQRLASERVQITLNGIKYDSAGEVARELDFAMARASTRRR